MWDAPSQRRQRKWVVDLGASGCGAGATECAGSDVTGASAPTRRGQNAKMAARAQMDRWAESKRGARRPVSVRGVAGTPLRFL